MVLCAGLVSLLIIVAPLVGAAYLYAISPWYQGDVCHVLNVFNKLFDWTMVALLAQSLIYGSVLITKKPWLSRAFASMITSAGVVYFFGVWAYAKTLNATVCSSLEQRWFVKRQQVFLYMTIGTLIQGLLVLSWLKMQNSKKVSTVDHVVPPSLSSSLRPLPLPSHASGTHLQTQFPPRTSSLLMPSAPPPAWQTGHEMTNLTDRRYGVDRK